jgi:hypothetical protein
MGALGNRATKTAKNIRRKSRRKPRKYRTSINTRKRLGRGYDGSWRHNMATRPNNERRIPTSIVGNEILAPYFSPPYFSPYIVENEYEDDREHREHIDVKQFVDDIASLEEEYHDMSDRNREATRDIEYQKLTEKLTGEKRIPRTQKTEDYTRRFLKVLETWNSRSMSNDKKEEAFKLYETKYKNPMRYYIKNGPCDRTFGLFMNGFRLP